ncbi:unnamed protein product, partial [Iphiclides podalirius]
MRETRFLHSSPTPDGAAVGSSRYLDEQDVPAFFISAILWRRSPLINVDASTVRTIEGRDKMRESCPLMASPLSSEKARIAFHRRRSGDITSALRGAPIAGDVQITP